MVFVLIRQELAVIKERDKSWTGILKRTDTPEKNVLVYQAF